MILLAEQMCAVVAVVVVLEAEPVQWVRPAGPCTPAGAVADHA